jgi:ribosomal protein S18 acetylase RimI-like enzyme
VEAVHAFAELSGVLSITLETHIENTGAQALYRALGYEAQTDFALYSKTLLARL